MQLTAEQKDVGRRNFLKAAATLPAVGAFSMTATNAGPIKVGVVGTGMEGRILMNVMNPKYVFINALCDIRPDNRAIGAFNVRNPDSKLNPNLDDSQIYERYEDMLESADIEAVIIATPLKYHGPMAIQALKAGKHVFTEKSMAYTVEECQEMIKLSKQYGLNLQVGHQRFYNPLYWDMYRMVTDGLLGNVYHIRTLWHRNTDWNYFKYIETKYFESMMNEFDPTQYGYEDIYKLVNWRWYSNTSHGLWTELCSHQTAITNWIFGDKPPISVMASGGHYKVAKDFDDQYRDADDDEIEFKKVYESDDRDINDHVYATLEYEGGRTVTYSAIQSNSFDNYYEQIMGTYGTIILSKENEYYLFWEPGWSEDVAKEASVDTAVEESEESAAESAFAAHASGEAPTGGGGASGMTPYEPYGWELDGFAHTIRTGAPNLCDGYRGMIALQAALAGKESIETGKRVILPKIVV
ncbi:MAG: Gfo/Idh/MocA family oxidoreductase [Candidatus Hinthialibacter antarcticus]|nr:Gfo/Idh/MocA family oxidoreductase [Candidatus Hinthialibacter antarcticus]